ncbi:MAG TPA: nitrile hydratase subunit beta [Acidimicrobiia bacterium]|nr:nitrile hydratase subunit beta [Acidimicrobiia bacterium]HMC78977.1 nitrile hydratase subunit beta [Acidimicrobiia bacterium]
MNGVHDLGGTEGLGRVAPTKEGEEPVFYSDWERAVFAMLVPSLLAGINLDEFRHGIERMHPAEYLSSRYYEHWLYTMEKNLIEKGVIDAKELEERTRYYLENPGAPLPARQDAEQTRSLLEIMRAGVSTRMPKQGDPQFKPGQPVRVKNYHPSGHTRLARYLRGKLGIVDRVYDSFVFPDTNSKLEGENPQHVYSVRFDAQEVWGPETSEPAEMIYFDFWEPYLEAA